MESPLAHSFIHLQPKLTNLWLSCADDYVEQRASAVRSGIRKYGRCKKAPLPVAVVESSSKCDVDSENAKVLPDGTQWVKVLLEQVSPALAAAVVHTCCMPQPS